MGMAASQARLLSITARLSDNEQSGQQLSYAKERLADKTDQVTKEYNEALKATKLQIMTGYADGAASYTDISFVMLSSDAVVDSLGKQYIVTDTKGRVLVQPEVAQAFQKANGSLNIFLGALVGVEQGGPFSVSDIDPTIKASGLATEEEDSATIEQHSAIQAKIHEAWDKYFHSVNKEWTDADGTVSHNWSFGYINIDNDGDDISGTGEGYATISIEGITDGGSGMTQPLVYEGTSQEQLELYNYAMAITESYYSAHDFKSVKTAYDKGNSAKINYYTNLYNKMLTSGYYSYTNTLATANSDPEHWLYDNDLYRGASIKNTKDTSPLTDPNTFEQYLKNGTLLIEVYSASAGKFVSTSLSADTCIQEVEDETKIAAAQAQYENDLQQIQRLDTRYDLQMKQLDTEHNTLQTEYESVKNVITKNLENSFQTFG